MPLVTAAKASPAGNCQTPIAIARPTINPASEDCQAGHRARPSKASTTTIGRAAITKESGRFPATGVKGWLNMTVIPPGKIF